MSNTQPFMPEPEGSPAAAAGPPGSPLNIVLASIGLLSLMADQITAWMERSVQRGNAVVERAQAEAGRRAAPRANDERQIELPHPALPTHRDFEVLLQRVTELEQQIDQIAAQRAAGQ
jgi:hypothetical protein